MPFQVQFSDARARVGSLKTAHGRLQTPFFMPVATKGVPKLVDCSELEEMGYCCFISNAFLLSLKPGVPIIEQHGGLHAFMDWKHSIFTDSGGFQVLNGKFAQKVVSEGVWMKSPFDGTQQLLTPEKAVSIQNQLDSDVAMCLDDVPHFGNSRAQFASSLKRTLSWAERCKAVHSNSHQLLFGISQGGTFSDLRKKGIEALLKLDFDGIALGGLCIGEGAALMEKTVKASMKYIPSSKPVYLMGVGSIDDILDSIALGVDIFDSAFPTRMARHGHVFTSRGDLRLDKKQYASDFSPLDEGCSCPACTRHTRAYLHHLLRVKEPTGLRLLSHHNLQFLEHAIERARQAIRSGEFASFRKSFSATRSSQSV
ncbi:MAG: tRNA guanosine(34) transglycosylase Tgt [Candidatus Diapherotrites archaeon]